MINPILIARIFVVLLVGIIVYRRTKNKKKALIAALITFMLVWGISFVADLFME